MKDWGHGEPGKPATDNGCEYCKPDLPCAIHDQIGGSHYKMPIEPLEFIMANNLPYCESNVVKLICRHEKKNGAEDIEKAIHYLKIILQKQYNQS